MLVSLVLVTPACNGGPPSGGASLPGTSRVEALRSRFATALTAPEEVIEKRDADVSLPATARGAFTVRDARTGMSVEVALIGATDAPASPQGGLVLYPGGYAGGADVLHRVHAGGAEDFVAFEREPAATELSYTVTLGKDVAGLRQMGGNLELLDAGGAPRLHMAPPFVVDGEGATHLARVTVQGCAVDQDPRLPWGRPVTPPGAERCTVRVAWDTGLAYPALVDPSWTGTASMNPRTAFTLTTLSSGKVLAVGLSTPGVYAEVYDPSTATWTRHGAAVLAGVAVSLGHAPRERQRPRRRGGHRRRALLALLAFGGHLDGDGATSPAPATVTPRRCCRTGPSRHRRRHGRHRGAIQSRERRLVGRGGR